MGFRLDSEIRPQNVYFHHSFWREHTLAATKLFLSLTRIDFVVAVSSRAVRVSPALSLRRARPSYGTFSLMGFQGNSARGRTGHMIDAVIKFLFSGLISADLSITRFGSTSTHGILS